MPIYKIELKKILDEYMEDIIEELENDPDFDMVEDLEGYVERHIDQPDGCVFPVLEFEISTPEEINNQLRGE